MGAGVVEGSEPDLVDEDEVSAQCLFDDSPDAVVGEAAVEGLDELGGGEVADPPAGVDRGVADGDEQVALAGPGRPDETQVLPRGDPFEAGEVVEVAALTDDALTSNSSRVLVTGKPAAFSRSRALDASLEAISASIRVRRNSSGDHRWVLAVTSSSGARRRMAPRREPSESALEVGSEGRCRGGHVLSPIA